MPLLWFQSPSSPTRPIRKTHHPDWGQISCAFKQRIRQFRMDLKKMRLGQESCASLTMNESHRNIETCTQKTCLFDYSDLSLEHHHQYLNVTKLLVVRRHLCSILWRRYLYMYLHRKEYSLLPYKNDLPSMHSSFARVRASL